MGSLGWLILTYENNIPVCVFVNTQECKKVPILADERICGDTFMRVEKINDLEYVVSDIWMYNSNCIFACSTFSQRYEWLEKFLTTFIQSTPETAKLIHKSKATEYKLRGYEEHSYEIGKHGYFVEKEDDYEILNVKRLTIPDCYEVEQGGYLLVPNMKTSVYLRSKGDQFTVKGVKQDEEFWDIVEDIPEVK